MGVECATFLQSLIKPRPNYSTHRYFKTEVLPNPVPAKNMFCAYRRPPDSDVFRHRVKSGIFNASFDNQSFTPHPNLHPERVKGLKQHF